MKPIKLLLIFLCLSISSVYAEQDHYGDKTCQFVRNYDGDTLTVNIPGYPDIIGKGVGIRIAGIDTPELRSKKPEVKAIAYQAKRLLTFICKNAKKIELQNMRRGKYFRILADVYADGINVADILKSRGFAKDYDGETKPEWHISS